MFTDCEVKNKYHEQRKMNFLEPVHCSSKNILKQTGLDYEEVFFVVLFFIDTEFTVIH